MIPEAAKWKHVTEMINQIIKWGGEVGGKERKKKKEKERKKLMVFPE